MRHRLLWLVFGALGLGLAGLWCGSGSLRCAVWELAYESDSVERRGWALAGLRREDPLTALPGLIRALSDPSHELAEEARESLVRAARTRRDVLEGLADATRDLRHVLEIGRVLRDLGPPGCLPLLERLSSPEPELREGAAWALAQAEPGSPEDGHSESPLPIQRRLWSQLDDEASLPVQRALAFALLQQIPSGEDPAAELLLTPALRGALTWEAAELPAPLLAAVFRATPWRSPLRLDEAFLRLMDSELDERAKDEVYAARARAGVARPEERVAALARWRASGARWQGSALATVLGHGVPEAEVAGIAAAVEAGEMEAILETESAALQQATLHAALAAPEETLFKYTEIALEGCFGRRAPLLRALIPALGGPHRRRALSWICALTARSRHHSAHMIFFWDLWSTRPQTQLYDSSLYSPRDRLPGNVARLAAACPEAYGEPAAAILDVLALFDPEVDMALSTLCASVPRAREVRDEREDLQSALRPILLEALDELPFEALLALGPSAPKDRAVSILRDALLGEDEERALIAAKQAGQLGLSAELEAPLRAVISRELTDDEPSELQVEALGSLSLSVRDDRALFAETASWPLTFALLQLCAARRTDPELPEVQRLFSKAGADAAFVPWIQWARMRHAPSEAAFAELQGWVEVGGGYGDFEGMGPVAQALPITELLLRGLRAPGPDTELAEVAISVAMECAVTEPRSLELLALLIDGADEEARELAREATRRLILKGTIRSVDLPLPPGGHALSRLLLWATLGPLARERLDEVRAQLDGPLDIAASAMLTLSQLDPTGAACEAPLLAIAEDARLSLPRRACAAAALGRLTRLSAEARARLRALRTAEEPLRSALPTGEPE